MISTYIISRRKTKTEAYFEWFVQINFDTKQTFFCNGNDVLLCQLQFIRPGDLLDSLPPRESENRVHPSLSPLRHNRLLLLHTETYTGQFFEILQKENPWDYFFEIIRCWFLNGLVGFLTLKTTVFIFDSDFFLAFCHYLHLIYCLLSSFPSSVSMMTYAVFCEQYSYRVRKPF